MLIVNVKCLNRLICMQSVAGLVFFPLRIGVCLSSSYDVALMKPNLLLQKVAWLIWQSVRLCVCLIASQRCIKYKIQWQYRRSASLPRNCRPSPRMGAVWQLTVAAAGVVLLQNALECFWHQIASTRSQTSAQKKRVAVIKFDPLGLRHPGSS